MLFTYDDFRAEEGLRAELASFLNSEVGQIAMRVMRMKYRPCDVPSNADSLASVRVLSQLHGTSVALDDLELLATAPTPNVNIEATYEATETDHVNIDEILKPQIIISKETQA